jgi:pimeloyl-ACP methyl ester carboxylesterase
MKSVIGSPSPVIEGYQGHAQRTVWRRPTGPQARVKIYPDSAHGFLFQHHAEFAADVETFLAGPD